MKVRGMRECVACGTQFSYYETGALDCPDCGSPRNVGVDEPTLHTDAGGSLELEPARALAADDNWRVALEEARDAAREYTRRRGFVRGGDLLDLDEEYGVASELKAVADQLLRSFELADGEQRYVLALLEVDEPRTRPANDLVPASMHGARGRAVTAACDAYRRAIRLWLDDQSNPPDYTGLLGRLDSHTRRFEALDGDVSLEESDALLEATRAVGTAARTGHSEARATATAALDDLES